MDLKMDRFTDDLIMSNGDLVLTGNLDNDEVRQKVRQRLETRYGEWFLNKGVGVPYVQRFLANKNTKAALTAYLIRTIKATDGVVDVNSISVDFDKQLRTYKLTCNIVPIRGESFLYSYATGAN